MSLRYLCLISALLFGVGCASISSVQTADTLGKGHFQVGVEPGLWGGASNKTVAVIPHVDASVRFGVADRVDLGFRAGSSFLEFQTKFMLTDRTNPLLALSLAPSLGGEFFGSNGTSAFGLINFALPVLVGFKLGSHQLILGPRLEAIVVTSSTPTALVGAGTSLGFAWRLADNLVLLPEVAMLYPFFGGSVTGMTSQGLLEGGAALVQFKLGILFGRFADKPTPAQREPLLPVPGYQDPLPPPPPPPPSL